MQAGQLTRIGGEFADPVREARFRAERLHETIRHARILFALSALLNSLFFISDWRFAGTPHFWVAIPARTAMVLLGLACLSSIVRARSFARAEAVMVAWMWTNALGASVLVSSHSTLALFIVIIAPMIYWLTVPTSFRWTVFSGFGSSLLLLAGYMLPETLDVPSAGLVLVMLMLNGGLLLVVARSNRLVRLEALATERLADSRRALETMFMASPIPMVVTSRASGEILHINELAKKAIGGNPTDLDLKSLRDAYSDPQDRRRLLQLVEVHGQVTGFETRAKLPDGRTRDVIVSMAAIELDGQQALMAGFVDITQRKAIEAHLAQLATTDGLTGLANRGRFYTDAEEAAARIRGGEAVPLSMLVIDLDHFKRVNDEHGHEAGDRALKAAADLMVEHLPAGGTAARLGGEEFAMLLPGVRHADARRTAERLRAAIESHDCSEIASGLRLTASIGLAELQAEETVKAAMSRADRALYSAKHRGRNRVHSSTIGDRAKTDAP